MAQIEKFMFQNVPHTGKSPDFFFQICQYLRYKNVLKHLFGSLGLQFLLAKIVLKNFDFFLVF
jgi:hypothetical protein